MKNQLLLIDGSSYIFRAYYGLKANLSNRAGLPTNAIVGFKNMLAQLFKNENPSHCVMVFDRPGPTFRTKIYPEYKANRSEAPDELKVQFQPIYDFCHFLKLPVLTVDQYEADDIIGSLAVTYGSEIKVLIISGDKDLTQLVTQDVYMLDTMKNQIYTPDFVKEKFGIYPDMIPEYLALVGDTADNIPGAQGIGPKSAVKLFDQFGNIEGIYNNLEQLKGKQKERLKDSKENVDLSLKLTKIDCSLEFEYNLDDFERRVPDLQKLKDFYQEMNFRPDDFLLTHPDISSTDSPQTEKARSTAVDYERYELVTSLERLLELQTIFSKQKELVMDLETTSIKAVEAEIVGFSFAWAGGNPVYIPVAHQEVEKQLSCKQVLDTLRVIFEDTAIRIIGQNIKYEMLVLNNYGIKLKGRIHDTMLQSYLLYASTHRHNLDELAERFLNHKMIKYEEVTGKGKKQIPFSAVPLDQALRYAAEDSDVTYQLHQLLFPRLQKAGLLSLYEEIELPLCKTLAKIEASGVKINPEYLQKLSRQLQAEILELEQAIYQESGEEFNINSPKQLGHILFEKMGITIGKKKNKTGYSTNIKVLEKIAWREKIGELLILYRTKTKLVNTYLEVLPSLINSETGRIHTSYHQAVTATGRLSSKDPNLQNIPIKGTDGKKIRAAFIADRGNVLVAADYSQIELRFLAHLSQDASLIKIFKADGDIHRETAAAIYGVQPEQVEDKQRQAAKAINFGIIYGMGAFRLSQEIKVSNSEAKLFIETYFERYPKIQTYMDETINFCRKNGFVETMFQRKRAIPEINSGNRIVKSAAERVAINSRIQGSAADLIKIAMIRIQEQLEKNGADCKMIMQVHDELVFEVRKNELEASLTLIKTTMEQAAPLDVPLVVDIGVGENWREAH
jgi:DNA polymerase-1